MTPTDEARPESKAAAVAEPLLVGLLIPSGAFTLADAQHMAAAAGLDVRVCDGYVDLYLKPEDEGKQS
jgi:hypothetical protein